MAAAASLLLTKWKLSGFLPIKVRCTPHKNIWVYKYISGSLLPTILYYKMKSALNLPECIKWTGSSCYLDVFKYLLNNNNLQITKLWSNVIMFLYGNLK